MPDNPVTLREAAKELGVRPGRLHELITRYPIPTTRLGNSRFLNLNDARALVEAHPSRAQVKGVPTPAPAGTFQWSA